MGSARIDAGQAERHLAALTGVFDATTAVLQTPFPFASDLSADARPIAIDGSRELIEGGYHREAMFWIVATYSRCQAVLYSDAAPEMRDRFHPGYLRLLADFGITAFDDLSRRAAAVVAQLPEVWRVCESILAANLAIQEDSGARAAQ